MVSVTVGLNIDTFSEIKNLAKKNKVSIRQQIDDIFADYKKCQNHLSEPSVKPLSEAEISLYDEQNYTGKQIKDWLAEQGFLNREVENASR